MAKIVIIRAKLWPAFVDVLAKNRPLHRNLSTTVKRELDLPTKLSIEEKWSAFINRGGAFDEKNTEKEKCYVCPMFPYPSGDLHMGHVRVYTISDAIARFERLNGKNVLHPMGFDSFGLPAENAAIENKVDPAEWTEANISKMRKRLKHLGCSFDWSRELITSDPKYFKFTQYLFLLMYKHGLVYRKKAWVNWDPVDKTVLADEQVDAQGRSWRSGAQVEKKLLDQWFIRTTNFAESLREGLENEGMAEWRDVVKLQKHWIGECEGAEFAFMFHVKEKPVASQPIWVRNPEHITRAAFVAITDIKDLECFGLEGVTDVSDVRVVNPFTLGHLPVLVVPRDQLDYPDGWNVKLCIPSQCDKEATLADQLGIPYDPARQMDNFDERVRICQLAIASRIGGHLKSSKLRDWLVSRQRRWGTPIPVIHCPDCGPVPVPFDALPVPLAQQTADQLAPCPECGKIGHRETDTMDTFVDSSWYYLRYIDPFNEQAPFEKDKVDKMMPVDVYIGGKEHATLHLYYARFVSHFLHSIDLLPKPEPFKRLLVQGMVMGRTYYVLKTKKVIHSSEVYEKGGKFFKNDTNEEVVVKWEKMSKSKHNGVEPSQIFGKYGVDTSRLLILGDVAPTSDRLWKEEAFEGVLNFQDNLWTLVRDFCDVRQKTVGGIGDPKKSEISEEKSRSTRNYYVRKISFNYRQSYQLSVALSKMQSLVKVLKKMKPESMATSAEFEKTLAHFLIMLAPMAPHFATELWSKFQSCPNRLGTPVMWDKSVLEQTWPELDDDYPLDIIVKVNNAVKATVDIPYGQFKKLTKDSATQIALSNSDVINFLRGRDVLSTDFAIFEANNAIINIRVDHRQPKKSNEPQARSSVNQ
ncbi:Leucyl-tRNA synthetase [Nesidiocoris tenuis]|nr:Leucyl-tRNA synthetase [Nesidiocoris tenuis]